MHHSPYPANQSTMLVAVQPNPAVTMLAPAGYLEMPPLVTAATPVSPIYATAAMQGAPPSGFMQGYQPQQQQKSKRTWLNRVSSPLSSPRQNLHPAAMIHRDYLQEYREKYGVLSPEHRISQLLVDPWHTPIAHHIHPAVVGAASTSPHSPSPHGICACPGTKKLGKPCKKCGLRVAAVNKGGTVRGGTVRGASSNKVRPSLDMNQNAPTISPMRLRPTPTSPQDEDRKIMEADPYDMMRRSRLSLQDKQGSIRTRSKSVSPSRARLSFPPTIPARTTSDTHRSRLDEWVACNDTPPLSSRSNSSDSDTSTRNKSILECDVSAYELISKYIDPDPYESDNLSDNAILDDDSKWKTPTTIPRIATKKPQIEPICLTVDDRTISMPEIPKPPPRLRRRVKKSTIKSILKKTSMDESPPVIEQQPRFPTYQEFKQRKKQVQFTEMLGRKCAPEERQAAASEREAAAVSATSAAPENTCVVVDSEQDKQPIHGTPSTELARSPNETPNCESKPKNAKPKRREGGSIVHIRGDHHKLFIDTMRLRLAPHHRADSRDAFPAVRILQNSHTLSQDLTTFKTDASNDNDGASTHPDAPSLIHTSQDDENSTLLRRENSYDASLLMRASQDDANSSLGRRKNSNDASPLMRTSPDDENSTLRRRENSRDASSTMRMLSPTRPKEPPPPPPPKSNDVIIVTSPDTTLNSSIVTVNDEIITDTSSNESEYNTLRINIGNDLATILTVNSDDYEPVIPPHVCCKNEITISDTSIIEKVENKRRSKILSSIESPYVSTSIKVSAAEWNNNNNTPVTNIVVVGEDKKDDTSITDDESSTRSKFYVTVEEEDEYFDEEEIEDHYEMIRDPIYEEISEPQAKSIFEGASKYDILNYLVGARERGIPLESTSPAQSSLGVPGELLNSSATSPPCSELVSHVSDSSEDAAPAHRSSPTKSRRSSAEIERNDSGVGSETSQSSRSRWLLQRRPLSDHQADLLCEDCEQCVEPQVTDSGVVYAPLVCRKCGKRRSERREIITELLETEIKYGRDLRIMSEEFYRPMLVAGLLSQEQLDAIFLNVPELLDVSRQLAERLQDAVDIALDQGDEDLLTVNVGRQLLDCSHMLHAFETYCTRQGAASVLLSSLEKEKELLKIFLRVSQMENAVLRRMNLNSFLMVPVQRVTKYPLLLARLYKATPPHYDARELLKQAQQKIEAHLEHMNAEAKDLSSTKLWRRISIINVPYRKISSEPDMNLRLRKLALEVLGWGHDESSFVMEGRLLFTQPTDSNWRKGRTIKLSHLNALLVTHGKSGNPERAMEPDSLTFPRDTRIREAALLLLKDKAGRSSLLREPLSLDKCIICSELQDIEDCFEVQEIPTRDTFIFKAESAERTREWFRKLQFHAQGLGGWRRRRNALANIMMNGMVPRS